jgi:hypothetical protein
MFASCDDVELTVSTRLSKSSKLVDPSSNASVELSSVDVYAVTRRAASDFCEIFRFLRLSLHQVCPESTGTVPEGAGPHKFGTLAALSDVCNRFLSQNLPFSRKYTDRTKSAISADSRP